MDGGQDIQLSLNQVDAKLMAVEQDYERYKQMLEPYLGRTDLSDAEKEAVASIERAKAELAQKESALRKEKLALRKIELALMSQGRYVMFVKFLIEVEGARMDGVVSWLNYSLQPWFSALISGRQLLWDRRMKPSTRRKYQQLSKTLDSCSHSTYLSRQQAELLKKEE
ncbi:hypothetical protein MP638_007271 [Amoeboaphelidium occidentale]|nr:hypothetical protein MP638_007271 [Amoeboaphelidium occidentale]